MLTRRSMLSVTAGSALATTLPSTRTLQVSRLAELSTLTVAGADEVRVLGYDHPGDGGHALYARTGLEPSHPAKVQTRDGVWFELSPNSAVNVRAFGALGDGKHNDTDAFQRLNAYVAARGGGEILIPPGEYIWGRQRLTGQTGVESSWAHTGGLSFSGLSSPVLVRAEGVVLRTAPGLRFGAFDPISGLPVEGTAGRINPDQRAQIGFAMEFRDCVSVEVLGYPALEGMIGDQIIGGVYSSDPSDITGIQLDHDGVVFIGCGSVYAEIASANGFGRDGCQVGWPGLTAASPPKPHILKLRETSRNGRQGVSYVGGNALTIDDLNASHNGKNGVVSSRPGAGVDVEAENSIAHNLVLNDVRIFDNAGVGITDDAGDNRNVTINRGLIIGTTSWSIWNRKPGWRVNDSQIIGAAAHIYGDDDPSLATQVKGGTWSMVAADSPSGEIYAGNSGRSEFGQASNALFEDVTFIADRHHRIPYSLAAHPPTFRDCVFSQENDAPVDLQGVFQGSTRLRARGAYWNSEGSRFDGPVIRD